MRAPRDPWGPTACQATSAARARKEFVWFAFPGDFQHSEGNGPFQHRGQRQAQPRPAVGTRDLEGGWGPGEGAQALCQPRPSFRQRGVPPGAGPGSSFSLSPGPPWVGGGQGVGRRGGQAWGVRWGCGQGGRWGRPGHSRTSRPAPSQTKPQSRRASSRRMGDQAWRAPSAQPGAKPTLSEATAPDPAVAS